MRIDVKIRIRKIFLQKLNLQKQKSGTFSSLRNRPVRCRRDQTVGRRSSKILSLIFYLNIVFLREIWDQFIFWGPPGYHRQCKHKLPEDKDESLGMKLSLRDFVGFDFLKIPKVYGSTFVSVKCLEEILGEVIPTVAPEVK